MSINGQSGSALFGASLLKFVLFEMYNYLINFRPVLLGAPLQLGALSVRLVRLWVNPAQVSADVVDTFAKYSPLQHEFTYIGL